MNNYLKISENIWLVISILTVLVVGYFLATEGFGNGNYKLLFLPLVSGAMYMFRRIQRTKSQK
ncbi:MAG: hypothetical protein POELPBGB_02315 [Bacteroidia bacterium]|nr:hypothetical protein [Bacteroidia bacterium]